MLVQGMLKEAQPEVFTSGTKPSATDYPYRMIYVVGVGVQISNGAIWETQGQSDPTGSGKDYWGASLPTGYVFASGKTIGNADSNATERADDDTFDLFSLLWTAMSNDYAILYDSAGSPQARGATALDDFNDNCQISVPDKRGRVSVGKDNMGGSTAGRITEGASGFPGTTMGIWGGNESHTLIENEIPSHTHTQSPHHHGSANTSSNVGASEVLDPTQGAVVPRLGTGGATATVTGDTTATNAATGGGVAHRNIQPMIICNYIIKL